MEALIFFLSWMVTMKLDKTKFGFIWAKKRYSLGCLSIDPRFSLVARRLALTSARYWAAMTDTYGCDHQRSVAAPVNYFLGAIAELVSWLLICWFGFSIHFMVSSPGQRWKTQLLENNLWQCLSAWAVRVAIGSIKLFKVLLKKNVEQTVADVPSSLSW